MESYLNGYEPHKGSLNRLNKGALVSSTTGKTKLNFNINIIITPLYIFNLGMTTAYAINNMEQFGTMFIRPN